MESKPKVTVVQKARKIPTPVALVVPATKKPVVRKKLLTKSEVVTLKPLNNTRPVAAKKKALVRAIIPPRVQTRVNGKKKAADQEEVSLLTGPVSLRLQEKRWLYEKWFSDRSVGVINTTATIFGYIFIFTGLFVCLLIITPELRIQGLPAAIFCQAGDCTKEEENPTSELQEAATVTFSAFGEIDPAKTTEFRIEVKNASQPVLVISAATIITPLLFQPVAHDENVYVYQIPADTFITGEYKVRIEAYTNNNTKTSFVGQTINILLPTKETPVISTNTASTTEGGSATTTEDLLINSQVANKNTLSEPLLALTLQEDINETLFRVQVQPMYLYDAVDIYLRQNHATIELFIGTAEENTLGWFLNLNTKNLPKGHYTLIAKGIDQGEVKAEAEISLSNKKSQIVSIADYQVAVSKNLTSATGPLVKAEDHAGTTSKVETTATTTEEFVKESEEKLSILTKSEQIDLDLLWQRYITVTQTSNTALSRAVEKLIAKKVTSLVTVRQNQLNDLAAVASFEVGLQKVVSEQKKVALNQSTNSVAYHPDDSDKDGLSDFDEIYVLATDFRNPDTDDDGIMDGFELINNFAPLINEPEAVLRFSALDLGEMVTDDSVLALSTITPMAWYKEDINEPLIYSEITGFSIPNSYTYIVFPEENIFLLTKADSTGAFSYFLGKEFTEGKHQAYVALLDNEGAAIVSSKLYTFTKTGTTYTTEYSNLTAVSVATSQGANSSSNKTGALGLVTFGLILILLSKSLKVRNQILSKIAPAAS